VLFEQGEEGDRLYILEEGEIELRRNGELIATINAGEIIGEIALIAGSSRTATGTAKTSCKLFELTKRDFDRVCHQAPEIAVAVRELAGRRLEYLGKRDSAHSDDSTRWAAIAAKALQRGHRVPTPNELRKEAAEQSGAPIAMWLGALLDGVPESFVLGTTFFGLVSTIETSAHPMSAVPMTLLAGLFLSNFPEAMSSSVGMKSQGWKPTKILLLWGSLTVVTAFLTMGGFVFGGDVSEFIKIGAEGLAAGAMLTMIAQTMIPEAVHLGGASTVGLSTLAGFLVAVAFKLIEA
jgi:CRP-like cAMP-binding protein